MSGWNTVLQIRRLEKTVTDLGLKFSNPKHAGGWEGSQNCVGLVPLDDNLPVYARDAELFAGTLAEVETWIHGVQWARNYDQLNSVSNTKKRNTAEQKERNRQLLKTLKENKLPERITK